MVNFALGGIWDWRGKVSRVDKFEESNGEGALKESKHVDFQG